MEDLKSYRARFGERGRRVLGRGVGRRPERSDYAEGDTVRIKSGPFASFTGKVAEALKESAVIKVLVNIFGRATPVDIVFGDAEKIDFSGGGWPRKQTP